MKLKGFFTKSEPLHISSDPTGEMSDWEKSGAFPTSKDIRPIMEDMDDMDDSENEGLDPIFSDEGFDGEFETLSNVNGAWPFIISPKITCLRDQADKKESQSNPKIILNTSKNHQKKHLKIIII